MRHSSRIWTAAVAFCTGSLVVAALSFRRSFQLTAFSDWIQCLLLLSATISLIPNAARARGRLRVFWALLAMGMAFWFAYQAMWTYFEVWLRKDVPDLFAADIVLFLHIVPLMAALALRPHALQDEYSTRLRRLDFGLMMVWWMYLYVFAVMAWQYVVANVNAYDSDLNFLYLIEKVAFLTALALAWWNSRGGWRNLYANLFGASLTYAGSSYLANWAISRHVYYSGSLYDIPLVASMAWITLIGLWSRDDEPQIASRSSSTAHGLWLARLGMIAVFSLPLLAAWALAEPGIPGRIRSFRLMLTLGAALVMGIMVFVRQRFLDSELRRLLAQSQESFANLKRLQAQITESEKLSSIAQLVGGAAHELNNPIAAMLGYSDLLLSTKLSPEQQDLATKVGQQVRSTRSLVASLVSFAKQSPTMLAPVDLKTILQTAVKLSEPISQALKIEVELELAASVAPVMGDSNQLLQVSVQMLHSALGAASQFASGKLMVLAEQVGGMAVIRIIDQRSTNDASDIPAFENKFFDSASAQPVSGLGRSACEGIVRQHHGSISWQQSGNAGVSILLKLPVMTPRKEKGVSAAIPGMWKPQSFA